METELVGISQNIQRIRNQIDRVANTGLNTIVCGETGVGKEVVVCLLHKKSDRNHKPLIKVNCAALPDTLLESEMFGYEKGAFTGAVRRKRGKIEQASGGLLFLDEIGDMALPLQSKLLHVLQDGYFTPLGSEQSVGADMWVVAATNRDLKKYLETGKFREDLFYRLGTILIHIEPLRRRPEDIPGLIDYYIQRYASLYKSKQLTKPDQKTVAKLCAYKWPGNVRELQNVLRQIMIMGENGVIIDDKLGMFSTAQPSKPPLNTLNDVTIAMYIQGLNLHKLLEKNSFSLKKISKEAANHVERQVISNVLEQTDWNRTKAAKILKVSYKSLFQKIKELDLIPPQDQF